MTGTSWPPSLFPFLTSVLLFRMCVAFCPQQCDCTPEATQIQTKMICKRGPLTSIPQDVPGTQIIVIDGEGRNDININYILENSFTRYVKLEELTIVYAGVKFIHRKAFQRLTQLLRVDLHNNQIEYLDEQIFSTMKYLAYLDLSNNKIGRVYRDMFAFPFIQMLSLKDNGANLRDRYLFQNLSMVDVLDISGNDVGSDLPAAFHGVNPYLRVLRMNSCGISQVAPELIKLIQRVHSLELKNNYISEISPQSFSHLTNLNEIYLDNNDLHTLDSAIFQRLQLRVLGLGGNNISVLKPDTFHNTSIGHIILSQNSISHIPPSFFSPINVIQKIQLDGNPLKYIGAETFSGLSVLDYLDLSNTQLHGFSLNAFSGINIRFLDLSKNSIMTISEKALQQFEKIDLVEFSDNPWHCTCFIKPLKKWLSDSNYGQNCSVKVDPKARLTDLEKRPFTNCLKCTTPLKNENETMLELTDKQIEQCYYVQEGKLTLDQQVLICAGVGICVLVISVVAYALFQRRNVLKYTLKGRTDIITNKGVGSRSGSRAASKADLTDTVATEPASLDPNVKLENISAISQPGLFDPEAENIVNGIIYRNSFTPKTPEVNDEKTPEVNGNNYGYVTSLESCV
ncbi:insulin-like growth factor-binding protein complex acid labile subunit isoform X2 [Lineus longissimus]